MVMKCRTEEMGKKKETGRPDESEWVSAPLVYGRRASEAGIPK